MYKIGDKVCVKNEDGLHTVIEIQEGVENRIITKCENGWTYNNPEEYITREITSKPNNVEHPKHYTVGSIECIEFIEDQDLPYHLGNAVKYITRCRFKGNEEEDINKAIWYLERYLKQGQLLNPMEQIEEMEEINGDLRAEVNSLEHTIREMKSIIDLLQEND